MRPIPDDLPAPLAGFLADVRQRTQTGNGAVRPVPRGLPPAMTGFLGDVRSKVLTGAGPVRPVPMADKVLYGFLADLRRTIQG
jgi:hypothetical protein